MLKSALRLSCTVLILGDMLGVAFAAERKPSIDEDTSLLGSSRNNPTLNNEHNILILDKRSENYRNRVNALHDDFIEYKKHLFEDKEESQKAKRLLKDKCNELRDIHLRDQILEKSLQIEPMTWDTLQDVRKGLGQTTFLDAPLHNTRKFVSGIIGNASQTS